jgi:hypothetical protein
MIPVAFYVLRERSRPSEEEARSFLMSCVLQCEGVDLTSGGNLAIHISNVMRPSEDLGKDFEVFIRQSGGEKYQGKPREYKWQFFEAETGDPPELTYLALVFALQGAKAKPMPPQPSVQEFLARGNRWEALGLWGNALLCFLIGQSLYPDDLDLKLRVGRAQLRQPNLVGAAYRPLLEVAESYPCAAEAAAALAECYLLMADNPQVEIRGSTRDELREWALMHLERAAALAPEDSVIRESRDLLRGRLGANPSLDFFSAE